VPITTGDITKPSRAGLALELQSRISEDPTLFDTVIDKVRGLHPTYMRSYYYGLREAIEKHKSISWDGAISVATWVVQQPAGAKTTLPFTEDTSWADTRSAILDLDTRDTGWQTRKYSHDAPQGRVDHHQHPNHGPGPHASSRGTVRQQHGRTLQPTPRVAKPSKGR
jgi:hypothetical protein